MHHAGITAAIMMLACIRICAGSEAHHITICLEAAGGARNSPQVL